MKLRFGPASPFVRKVLVVAHETGQIGDIELVEQVQGDPDGVIGPENPLGKIPVLALDDGTAIFESLLICDWLDHRAGGSIIPAGWDERFACLRRHALASGATDAALLRVYEGRRPEGERSPETVRRQAIKVARALDALERQVDDYPQTARIDSIALGCLLGYLDLRFPAENWRVSHARLADWFKAYGQRPAMAATDPKAMGA
ncbi:MAG: glutathione S-transferase [Alphaproteobacteria bacterium]